MKALSVGLPGTAEVERHTSHEGPEIELPPDEFRPIVDTNGLRTTHRLRCALERIDDVGTAILLPHIDRRREPA